jgi:hypothetical protein
MQKKIVISPGLSKEINNFSTHQMQISLMGQYLMINFMNERKPHTIRRNMGPVSLRLGIGRFQFPDDQYRIDHLICRYNEKDLKDIPIPDGRFVLESMDGNLFRADLSKPYDGNDSSSWILIETHN